MSGLRCRAFWRSELGRVFASGWPCASSHRMIVASPLLPMPSACCRRRCPSAATSSGEKPERPKILHSALRCRVGRTVAEDGKRSSLPPAIGVDGLQALKFLSIPGQASASDLAVPSFCPAHQGGQTGRPAQRRHGCCRDLCGTLPCPTCVGDDLERHCSKHLTVHR